MPKIRGDLLELGASGRFDVIVHGCNCMHRMGKGIAHSIRARFPESYEADKETVKGSRQKLGTYSCVTVMCNDEHALTIVNAYTQYHFSPRYGPNVDYDAIRAVFRLIKENFAGKRIGYPLIGAGLAGGDWDVISEIIDDELEGEDHTLVVFDPRR